MRSPPAYEPPLTAACDRSQRRAIASQSPAGRSQRRDWGTARGSSSLQWEHAKHATRDAWHRVSNGVERAIPGDSDRDGR